MNPPNQEPSNSSRPLIWICLVVLGGILVAAFGTRANRDNASNFLTQEKPALSASKDVVEVTAGNWEKEVVQSSTPVVVDFWAPWCGPCRQLSPTIDKLATKYSGRVKFCKVNVDDARELTAKYNITGIPRVFIFNGGDKPQKSILGLVSQGDLADEIDTVLQKGDGPIPAAKK